MFTVLCHETKGLQLQTAALTAKLAILPIARPPTRQKVATVAAISTSSRRPCNLGLCSREGADIMQRLDKYPLVAPNARRMVMNKTSELMIGVVGELVGDDWTLHIKNKGIKAVLARESIKRRFESQMRSRGNEQIYRPEKSPILNMRKWIALKSRGCVAGLVVCTEAVIGGKTACALQ